MNQTWFETIFLQLVRESPTVKCSPSIQEWKAEVQGNATVYTGEYAVFRQGGVLLFQIPGKIVVWPNLPTDVYIYDPPSEIRQLPEGPCFQLLSPGGLWFMLHWEIPACTFEESRAHVERILNQLPPRVLIKKA